MPQTVESRPVPSDSAHVLVPDILNLFKRKLHSQLIHIIYEYFTNGSFFRLNASGPSSWYSLRL